MPAAPYFFFCIAEIAIPTVTGQKKPGTPLSVPGFFTR
jgi:hypothetical protein